jgi:alcohol dehydrogenase
MRAAVYEEFAGPLTVRDVDDPTPGERGAVLRVKATGICRSDWHGWKGHDPDISLPHVPGHEISGIVESVGSQVNSWQRGDRVTLPFVCGCGSCVQCRSGNQQVCDRQFQPGFTAWGSYAEYVAIDYADENLVALPEEMDFVTAASLGCRFATSFRAVVAQARVSEGQWVVVHGCGGVGLSAIMIAHAFGANVIAVDVLNDRLKMAESLGAAATINADAEPSVVAAVRSLSSGGAHVSIDALGSRQTCFLSIAGLRKRGRHIQVGLMVGDDRYPEIPMDQVLANELEILGSHGMQAHEYGRMLDMIALGRLNPAELLGKTVSLDHAAANFSTQSGFDGAGVMVIDEFGRPAPG